MGAEVDRGSSYERTISELRNQTQQFTTTHAREVVTQAIALLQTAWNIERSAATTTSSRMTEDEQRRNR